MPAINLNRTWRLALFATAFWVASDHAHAQTATNVQYLANEGVMVTHEDTKVLFDPLFNNGFNRYQLVPEDMREAMFAGERPYDDVDAVFVSHYHGDHFSAEDMLRLLRAQESGRLYAPAQAVAAMRELGGDNEDLFDRVVGLDLEYGDVSVRMTTGRVLVEANFVPHSGWPTRMTDVQNLSFRVTLADTSTVLHLGDADPRLVHFGDSAYWDERTIDLALPPYWFFGSRDGLEILESRINIRNAIGIHVPAEFADPSKVPEDIRPYELFTRPGEGRQFIGVQ